MQVYLRLAMLAFSVLILQKANKIVLVAFNQQLGLLHVPLLLLVILHQLTLAVPAIIKEKEIQMAAQYAQLVFTVLMLQMLTLLFVQLAHIQVK